jgi:hypothetical protein
VRGWVDPQAVRKNDMLTMKKVGMVKEKGALE